MARHARVCTFAGSCVSASSGTVLVLRCVSYPPASPPPLGFRAPDRDRRSIDGSIDRSGFAPSYVVPRNRGVLETHDGRRRRVKKLKEKEKKSETKTLLGLSVDRSSIYIEVPRKSDGPSGLLSRTSEAPSPRFLFSLATPPVVVICANNSIIIKSLVHVIIYIFSILHSSNVGNSYSRRDGEEQREGTDPYRLEMCEAKFLDAESNRIESLKHNF